VIIHDEPNVVLFPYGEQIIEGGPVERTDSEYGIYETDSSSVVTSLLEKRESCLEISG